MPTAGSVDAACTVLLLVVLAFVWLAVMAVVLAMCVMAKAGDVEQTVPQPHLRLVADAQPVASITQPSVLG